MNKIYALVALMVGTLAMSNPLSSQTPSASFATWKDNKKAAYSIIHDDYSNYVPGIVNHADPIATARGIKLCFGAITNFCDDAQWVDARKMIGHGHECVNHSHNHRCGGTAGQCQGLSTYGSADFATELGLSTRIIDSATQVRPRFFIHPYDASSAEVLAYLKNLGYLGARSGNQGVVNANTITDFMNVNYFVYNGTAAALAGLNTAVDDAITNGGWAIREFHGIEDGSWSNMTIPNYTSHLDYVKTKMDDGSIWSATTTEAITYKMQRDAFAPVVAYDAASNSIIVSFNSLKTIDPSVLRTPVTVNVNLNGITGNFDVFQNNASVTAARNGNVMTFNVYPHQGTVTLKCNNCVQTPTDNVANLTATPQQTIVDLTWANPAAFDEIRIVAQTATITGNPTTYTTTGSLSAGKIVYSGIGISTSVTGLTASTLYHFKAFTRVGTTWSSGVEVTATTTAAPVIIIVAGCLKASYFNNITLIGNPVKVHAETKIDNNWAAGSPTAGLPADNFSVRWEGTINAPVAGTYTFTMTGDDGIRLWVNNQLIINKWIDQSATTYTATVALTQGQSVPVKMEYYERGGDAVAKLAWTVPTLASQIIAFEACPIVTPPVAGFDVNKCYKITARHSNKVLEVTNTKGKNDRIQQDAWKGTREQIWRIKNFDGTTYQIANGFSGKVMTVASTSLADGAGIFQYQNENANSQKWKLDKNTEGYYFFTAKHSGKVLDIYNGSTSNGADAIQWTKNGGNNQQFAIAETGCPANTAALTATYAVSFDGRLQDGKPVLQWVVNSENLTDYYELEKVNEQGDFKTLAVVNSTSQTAVRQFTHTDENPFDGDNFYRLKTIFNDGTAQVSALVNIKYAKSEGYTVFPNPAIESFSVDLSNATGKSVDIAIVTPFGKIIKQETIESASTAPYLMSLDGMESGQYFVSIKVQGKRSVLKKLVIMK